MDNFPSPDSALKALRDARQKWVNSGGDIDAAWELVEAFETLDGLLLGGYELPFEWRADVAERAVA